jgi:hypothetical protein
VQKNESLKFSYPSTGSMALSRAILVLIVAGVEYQVITTEFSTQDFMAFFLGERGGVLLLKSSKLKEPMEAVYAVFAKLTVTSPT